MNIKIYTDGSCRKFDPHDNTGIAGWGFVVVENNEVVHEEIGLLEDSTSNRGELLGILNGIKYGLKHYPNKPLIIYSDSNYSVQSITNWMPNFWLKNNWITSKKQPVLNRDILEQFIPYINNPEISIEKVKGHDTCTWNNYIDEKVQALTLQAKKMKGDN